MHSRRHCRQLKRAVWTNFCTGFQGTLEQNSASILYTPGFFGEFFFVSDSLEVKDSALPSCRSLEDRTVEARRILKYSAVTRSRQIGEHGELSRRASLPWH